MHSNEEFITLIMEGNKIGIDIKNIKDILPSQLITPIPLASDYILGSFNLRGRIVTAIDFHVILNMTPLSSKQISEAMNVVVEYNNELYSLMVEQIGEILSFSQEEIISNHENLPEKWSILSKGIHLLEEDMLIIIDINKIFKHYHCNNTI